MGVARRGEDKTPQTTSGRASQATSLIAANIFRTDYRYVRFRLRDRVSHCFLRVMAAITLILVGKYLVPVFLRAGSTPCRTYSSGTIIASDW